MSVEETSGALTAAAPTTNLPLVDIDAGQTLTVYAEATSGNLIPRIILRDYGGKALESGNLLGREPIGNASIHHVGDRGWILA